MGEVYRIQLGAGEGMGLSDSDAAQGRRYPMFWHNKPLTRFESQEQLLHIMNEVNPKTGRKYYETDPVYRETVKDLITSSQGVEGVNYDPTEKRAENFLNGLRRDALAQQYHELTKAYSGNDATAKLRAVEFMMNPDNAAVMAELEQAAGPPADGPLTAALKANGPVRYSFSTGDETVPSADGSAQQ